MSYLSYIVHQGQLNISDRINAYKQAGCAPSAQHESIGDYGLEGLGFESLRAHFMVDFDSNFNFIE
jgi:hypothetical protein